jgi:DNA-binding transcriptional regulator YiaG
MPNLSQVIKTEIARISRREIKAVANPIRNSTIILKRTAANLKKRIAALESDAKRLLAFYDVMQADRKLQAAQTPDNKARITAKGVRVLRGKLGLSQDSFARLLGVSSQAVYVMEHKEGRLNLRSATLANLLSVRGIGKREARARLAEKATPRKNSRKTGK